MIQRQIKTGVLVVNKQTNKIWEVVARIYNEVQIKPLGSQDYRDIDIWQYDGFKKVFDLDSEQ